MIELIRKISKGWRMNEERKVGLKKVTTKKIKILSFTNKKIYICIL